MNLCDYIQSKLGNNRIDTALQTVEEAIHVVEERSQHFRQHIQSINERLNMIEGRIDILIKALEQRETDREKPM